MNAKPDFLLGVGLLLFKPKHEGDDAQNRRCLTQEVKELTALLRHDPGWADLPGALEANVVLAGFMEDARGREAGVVITNDPTVFEYRRNTNGKSTHFTRWRRIADPATLRESFLAVRAGLHLASRR